MFLILVLRLILLEEGDAAVHDSNKDGDEGGPEDMTLEETEGYHSSSKSHHAQHKHDERVASGDFVKSIHDIELLKWCYCSARHTSSLSDRNLVASQRASALRVDSCFAAEVADKILKGDKLGGPRSGVDVAASGWLSYERISRNGKSAGYTLVLYVCECLVCYTLRCLECKRDIIEAAAVRTAKELHIEVDGVVVVRVCTGARVDNKGIHLHVRIDVLGNHKLCGVCTGNSNERAYRLGGLLFLDGRLHVLIREV